MKKQTIQLEFEVYASSEELTEDDSKLLKAARLVTANAYAPYSNFQVGAVALLQNGQTIEGTNQENASFPVGVCAERTLLGAAAMIHKDIPILTMAIAYHNLQGTSNRPVSPCGMCRQAIHEYEQRTYQPMRLILSGMEGEVYIIDNASQLLPLSFDGAELR